MLIKLWIAVQIIIGFNLILPMFLFLLHSIFRKKVKTNNSIPLESDYAIIVTAYAQTVNLKAVLSSILKLNYNNYIIYVVLDNCANDDFAYHHDKVVLLRPETVLAGNVKSHFYAINNFHRDHDRLTIIDSDNLVHPEFINELNKQFDLGFEAVQGIREAKNLNSMYACLDAARDIYYHYYDGKIIFEIGSSATLSGSGMAFSVPLYKSCFENKDVQGAGFDKVLQYEIVKRNLRIAFTSSAIVKDEKTTASDQLVNQRARWINTWFKYFTYGFGLIAKGITNFSWNQILFGLILLRPPLFMFLIGSFILMTINFWILPFYTIIWILGFLIFVLGFIISLVNSNADSKIFRSLVGIPKFMFYQVKSLIYSRNANKRSVATIHTNQGIDQSEENI